MAADKYSPRRGPEMDERRASKEKLSEERLESSPEVDRALYKHTIIMIIIITTTTTTTDDRRPTSDD